MDTNAVNGIKVFHHFPKLFPEIRMMVINEMAPDDRCRFTGCSHSCWIESRRSKNYIYGLEICVHSIPEITIRVVFNEEKYEQQGFKLKIVEESGRKHLIYSSIQDNFECWRTEFNDSTDIVQTTFEQFKKMLNLYQNTIKKLVINDFMKINYDFGITSLNRLEVLELYDDIDATQFITKLRKPLKELVCWETSDRYIEQISQVKNELFASHLRLNYQQFLQLSATNIYISVAKWTEADVAHFIRFWKHGRVRNSFKSCTWYTWRTGFDVQKLYRLLEIEYKGSNGEITEIKHNTEAGKTAEISCIAFGTTAKLLFCLTTDGNQG